MRNEASAVAERNKRRATPGTEALSFLVGAFAFSFAQGLWLLVCASDHAHRWTFKTGHGIFQTGTILAFALLCLGASARRDRYLAQLPVAYAGICLSLTVWMFALGPGNIWPIVLAVDYVLVAPFVVAGWGLGWALRRS